MGGPAGCAVLAAALYDTMLLADLAGTMMAGDIPSGKSGGAESNGR